MTKKNPPIKQNEQANYSKDISYLKVVKRSGAIQNFDIQKIRRTIANVSDEITQPLNKSDLEYISQKISHYLQRHDFQTINYFELHSIVVKVLADIGFGNISKAYNESDKSKQPAR